MSRKLFANMPVKDLAKSITFFKALGFDFNPQFTDPNAGCLIISEHNFAMLFSRPMFEGFMLGKALCDTATANEMGLAFTCETRAEVDELVSKALAVGGKAHGAPQDHGFMYQHGFEDLDGHIWEPFYMDPSQVQK